MITRAGNKKEKQASAAQILFIYLFFVKYWLNYSTTPRVDIALCLKKKKGLQAEKRH